MAAEQGCDRPRAGEENQDQARERHRRVAHPWRQQRQKEGGQAREAIGWSDPEQCVGSQDEEGRRIVSRPVRADVHIDHLAVLVDGPKPGEQGQDCRGARPLGRRGERSAPRQ